MIRQVINSLNLIFFFKTFLTNQIKLHNNYQFSSGFLTSKNGFKSFGSYSFQNWVQEVGCHECCNLKFCLNAFVLHVAIRHPFLYSMSRVDRVGLNFNPSE